MRVKIFSAHHERPTFPAYGDLFMPIWAGGTANGPWMTDGCGAGLPGGRRYDEMRHIYFAWRNLLDGLDYVGFEHYRRLFLLDPLPAADCARAYPRVMQARRHLAGNWHLWQEEADAETFVEYVQLRHALTGDQLDAIRGWIGHYDIVAPRRAMDSHLAGQWHEVGHSPETWQAIVAAVQESSYWNGRANYTDFHHWGVHFCNLCIMRVDLFDEYMQFWQDVMTRLEPAVDPASRAISYASERVFSLWLQHKQVEQPLLRMAAHPHLLCHDNDTVRRALAEAGISPAIEGQG